MGYLQGKLKVAPDAIDTLGPQLFGDNVNLYNGAISFEQTDASLPGNNALPVAVVRSWSPRPWWGGVRGAAADWDLNTPRIEGSFSQLYGFVSANGGGPGARCSNFNSPPGAWTHSPNGPVDFESFEYWQGTHLIVPGHGSQELLKRNPAFGVAPGDPLVYPIVTRNLWQLGCLNLRNGAGQGFFALSPQGVRYEFDWVATRGQVSLRKGDAVLPRTDWLLMATSVTDRFGNRVNYTYDPANPLLLTRIESTDGRVITLAYSSGRLASVFDGTRTWQYAYGPNGDLAQVVLPDYSRWEFNLRPMVYDESVVNEDVSDCDTPPSPPPGTFVGTMWHPSGAKGEFKTSFQVQGRSGVQRACTYYPGSTWTNGSMYPRATTNQALERKTISGPGIGTLTWQYAVSNGYTGDWAPCSACPDRKVTTVTHPDGNRTNHHFGIRWRVNDGLLLRTEEGWDGAKFMRATDYRYRSAGGQAYLSHFGTSVNFQSDQVSYQNWPQDQRIINQQGAQFTWEVQPAALGFDYLARPLVVTKSGNSTRTETTQYHDNTQLWVLGQVASVSEVSTGRTMEATTYKASSALPDTKYSFDLKTESYQYYADGTPYAITNAGGRSLWLGNYQRGQPGYVTFMDNAQERQEINNLGMPNSRTNAAGTTHSFEYDAMGRVSRVDYPGGDLAAYHPTQANFAQQATPSWGMPAGHWRQHIITGNHNVFRIFDALWRERVKFTWDGTDWNNTVSVVETRYDHEGRKTFVSYPIRNFPGIDQSIPGTFFEYDALGRVTRQLQDPELVTRTEYLPLVFQKRVTNPRGYATTYAFQAFDTPSEDAITEIWAPEGVNVKIPRDVFGKAKSITRGGPQGTGTVSATRWYVYEPVYQRLCKTIEPESGATVQEYDASGNVAWRANGQPLPNTQSCDQGSVPPERKISFGYDLRERLTSTTYGDNSQNITRTYTPDSLLESIETTGGGRNAIKWAYGYNNRRLLAKETYTWGDPNNRWDFHWGINANGHVGGVTDPWGWVGYGPNALGQPKVVEGYASGITYHANGAVASYTLNNGVAYTSTQNVRGLPATWRHGNVVNDRYTYDANGNVTQIEDLVQGLNRTMPVYDGLDRLREANGPWGMGRFDYDALDNVTFSQVGSRVLNHEIDYTLNRLRALSGSLTLPIVYDPNGNLYKRGSQEFWFDIGNRLMVAPGKATYAYDGHGRRNLVWYQDGTYAHQAYTMDGKLRFGWKQGEGHKRHVYLGDKLIAETREGWQTTYSHTDALGSPVARTADVTGAVVSRTRYEPYGATEGGTTNPNGIGFTGHVNDPDTGLVYMQQRYYDPIAGRFLSVDPVTTDVKTGRKFNRYVYGANNPYRFIDPDGLDEIDLLGGPQVGFGDACKAMCNNVKKNFVQIVVCVVCLANDRRPPPPPPKPPVPQKPVPGPKPPGDPKPPGPPGPDPAPPPGPGGSPPPSPGPGPGGTGPAPGGPSPTPQPGPSAPPPPPPPPPKPELPK